MRIKPDNRDWEWDINSYTRLLRLLSLSSNDKTIAYCTYRLAQIRSKYPNVRDWPT